MVALNIVSYVEHWLMYGDRKCFGYSPIVLWSGPIQIRRVFKNPLNAVGWLQIHDTPWFPGSVVQSVKSIDNPLMYTDVSDVLSLWKILDILDIYGVGVTLTANWQGLVLMHTLAVTRLPSANH